MHNYLSNNSIKLVNFDLIPDYWLVLSAKAVEYADCTFVEG